MKKFSFLFSLLLLLSFAQADAQEKPSINLEKPTAPKPPTLNQAPTGPTTTIEFEETSADFGEVVQGEKVQYVFKLTNTGTNPYIISNAKGSCGCTVPKWPKEPIGIGETADILVEFNSKGKSGRQSKTVTITGNTDPPQTLITIKGEVLLPGSGTPAIQLADMPKIELKEETQDKITLYPNPVSSVLQVKAEDMIGQSVQMEVFNSQGQLVSQKKVDEMPFGPFQYNVSDLESGVYTIKLTDGKGEKVSGQFTVSEL